MLAGVSVSSLRKRLGEHFLRVDSRAYISIEDMRSYLAQTRKKQDSAYVDAVQACYILGISRSWLESLVERGKVRKKNTDWRTYYNLEDLLKIKNDERK